MHSLLSNKPVAIHRVGGSQLPIEKDADGVALQHGDEVVLGEHPAGALGAFPNAVAICFQMGVVAICFQMGRMQSPCGLPEAAWQ